MVGFMDKKRLIWIYLLLPILVTFIVACSDDSNPNDGDEPEQSVASCEGCHTNYDYLVKIADPDTSAPESGCGGTIPHIDPWDRVFLGGDGYEKFKKSTHYSLGCTNCHNGNNETADKDIAHGGDFISHPSKTAQEKCGSCHADIVKKAENNIHHGYGQMRKVTMRSGLAGAHEFSKLPEHQQAGYNKHCAKCHAGCGECHVNRPKAGGGGLMNGHNFSKKPDMIKTCVTCHVSRGGHAYLGVAPGTKPDVHLTKMGYKCTDCHKELHGDGNYYDQRYAVAGLPKCKNCHKDIDYSNAYHSVHINSFNCQTCHSQEYNTCGSCHIGGVGARIKSHQEFKIALNPIPDIKKGFKFTLVRRTLAAPDNWEKYGVPAYAKFEAFPTFNYTSPHNILRWTERTKVAEGQSCSDNCHIKNVDGIWKNLRYYLFEEDLYDWELEATRPITVNGHLPESWGVK
jgi:thiosulfate/3-mercaptopyruvate sulfurtransferase